MGGAVVAVTAVLAKMFLFGDKKKKAPVTLQDPTVKYPLKLIDREVSVYLHFFHIIFFLISL